MGIPPSTCGCVGATFYLLRDIKAESIRAEMFWCMIFGKVARNAFH